MNICILILGKSKCLQLVDVFCLDYELGKINSGEEREEKGKKRDLIHKIKYKLVVAWGIVSRLIQLR